MPKTIEITMTAGGYEVVTGGQQTRFATLDAAVGFVHDRMARAEHIRYMKSQLD